MREGEGKCRTEFDQGNLESITHLVLKIIESIEAIRKVDPKASPPIYLAIKTALETLSEPPIDGSDPNQEIEYFNEDGKPGLEFSDASINLVDVLREFHNYLEYIGVSSKSNNEERQSAAQYFDEKTIAELEKHINFITEVINTLKKVNNKDRY